MRCLLGKDRWVRLIPLAEGPAQVTHKDQKRGWNLDSTVTAPTERPCLKRERQTWSEIAPGTGSDDEFLLSKHFRSLSWGWGQFKSCVDTISKKYITDRCA